MSTEEAAAPEASPAPSLTRLEPSGHVHGKPEDGLECMATMEDITEEDGNFCEYQTAPSMSWHAAKFSADVVRRLIYTQFEEYMANVRKADCEADLKRRLAKGPPVWVEDKHALPLPEDDTHVCRIWLASDSEEYSAKLLNCVEVCAALTRIDRPPLALRSLSRRLIARRRSPAARSPSAGPPGRATGAARALTARAPPLAGVAGGRTRRALGGAQKIPTTRSGDRRRRGGRGGAGRQSRRRGR